jgi:predicted ester cyclase
MRLPSGTRDPTSPRGNAAVVRAFVDEIVNKGRLDLVDEWVTADHISHCPDGDLFGPAGVRLDLIELRAAFPDLRMETADILADADRVARRFLLHGTHTTSFLGLPPSGHRVTVSGMAINRLIDHRLAESWITYDIRHLLRPSAGLP